MTQEEKTDRALRSEYPVNKRFMKKHRPGKHSQNMARNVTPSKLSFFYIRL